MASRALSLCSLCGDLHRGSCPTRGSARYLPTRAELHVVTGEPGAGKSTFVRDNAGPGDIVIDFDLLAQAIGSPVEHDHDDQYLHVARAMWRAARHSAVESTATVWLIHARPSDYRLKRYRREGTVHHIDRGQRR